VSWSHRALLLALLSSALASTVLLGCGKCRLAKDCPGGFCDQSTGKCISLCRSDLDCPPAARCNAQIGNCIPVETHRLDAATSTTGADASSSDGSAGDSSPSDAHNVD
jgi:hypothetical protein